MNLQEAVHEYLKERPDGASVPEIAAALSIGDKAVRSAIDRLRANRGVNIVNVDYGSLRFRLEPGAWAVNSN